MGDRPGERNRGTAVSGFSERMREQVDLDALRHELLAVVAVQPAHASLWLRPDASDAPPG